MWWTKLASRQPFTDVKYTLSYRIVPILFAILMDSACCTFSKIYSAFTHASVSLCNYFGAAMISKSLPCYTVCY